MWVEKRHHAFIKSQASTKAYAKSSSNPIRGGKYLLDHLIHFPANARQFLRVNFLVSAANFLCDCGSVILPLGCRCNFHAFPCISKQALFCSVIACVAICAALGVISSFHSGEHHQTLLVAVKGIPMEWGMGVLRAAQEVPSPGQGLHPLQLQGKRNLKRRFLSCSCGYEFSARRLSPIKQFPSPKPCWCFDEVPP